VGGGCVNVNVNAGGRNAGLGCMNGGPGTVLGNAGMDVDGGVNAWVAKGAVSGIGMDAD